MPLWSIIALVSGLILLASSAALLGVSMRIARRRAGCCPECGFDLREVHSGRCPECGGWIASRTFNPWERPGQFIQWLGIAPIVALLCILFLRVAHDISVDRPPAPPPDTTPPTLEVSFIGFDDEILSQSPTEIRVKPGTELINTTWADDDGSENGMVWYIEFRGEKSNLFYHDRLTVPGVPGTNIAHAYARDAAGNETTQEYRIVVVDEGTDQTRERN